MGNIQTNADIIRNMTDEELAKYLAELTSDFSVDIDEELDKYKKTIEFMKKIGI